MSYRLIDRQKEIPNGMFFYEPGNHWQSRPWSGFTNVVSQTISNRVANAWLNKSIVRAQVEEEVDAFVANHCLQMGWMDYITTGAPGGPAPPPFEPPPPPSPALQPHSQGVAGIKKIAAGAALLFDWEESKQPPVAGELAEKRAAICANCPRNDAGGLGAWFTVPLQNTIRAKLARLYDLNLTTSRHSELHVCSACACPLPLKIFAPLDLIEKHLKPEYRAELHPSCWILSRDA